MALLQTPSVKSLPATLLTGSPPQQEQQFNPAQMLGGFSAGLSGTLPQFMQAQNQTRQLDMQQQEIEDKKTEQRQATYFVDSAAMLNQLQNGNIDGALQIGLHRLQLLQGHKGVDPSDTQRLVMLAAGAKNGDAESADRLAKELSANVQLGQIYGVIPKPKPAEPIDANKINEAGQVPLYDANSGKITMQTVPGWAPNQKVPEAMKVLQMRAKEAGLTEGTQEYKDFMERGGSKSSSNMPVSLQELDALEKMTPEQQKNFWRIKRSTALEDNPDQAGLSGEDYLKTLPESIANTVRSIAEGRQTFSSLGVRGAAREQIVSAVNRYDPNYDEAEAKSRYKAMQDFSTGKNGNTVRSLNVSIDHLGTLQQAADALKNGNTQAFNMLGNLISSSTGNPAPTDFNATKKIVADEIVKGIVGSGGGVSDREEAAKSISAANSPQQLSSVIERYKDLLGGQLHGLKKQYEESTKRNDFDRFLTPQAKIQLEGRDNKTSGGVMEGQTATNPTTGEKIIYRNGKWSKM